MSSIGRWFPGEIRRDADGTIWYVPVHYIDDERVPSCDAVPSKDKQHVQRVCDFKNERRWGK